MSEAVSVVIPCHNAAATVDRQISAVLTQLWPNDELVLVDNRSTDATRAVLDAAAARDGRVLVVSAEERAGANHARNTGAATARHDVILFCDADDMVHPGWVDALRAALANGGIAGGAATPVDETGHRLGPDLGLHEIFGGPAYPLGASMGLHRDVLRAVGGFDESFAGGHDETDLAWRADAAGWPTVFVPSAYIDYVQRPDARTTVRQRRSYARTAIQLWTRHPETVDPHGVNLRGAVRNLAHNVPSGLRVLLRRATAEQAAGWGWNVGLLEGHLRYRLWGTPPPPVIPPIDSDS
ncbi:glycosyltransferase family 2 protein [Micrococcus endophyticus]|uniref:glycosyltransferase n=1 Tax=Micrococcus endophyticus TaxID=455343 RepID=UPI0035A8746C